MKFLKAIYQHYIRSNTFEKGAALSYYTVFSFLPIAMLISTVLGLVFREDVISGEMHDFLVQIFGDNGALQIEDIIQNRQIFRRNLFTTIVGILTLLFAATGMFGQIHKSLNAIWELKVKPEKSVFNYVARRLTSLAVLVAVGLFAVLSTVLNTFLVRYASHLPEAFQHVKLYEHLISFFLIASMVILLFKLVGNAFVPWITALVSGGVTTLLFFVGKIAISSYIAHSNINSTFGTASILALLMIWVYYSSQIIFIGASFAYIFGQRTGHEIRPTSQVERFVR